MNQFGLGYPRNYAKCREIAVHGYGTKLVFSFREGHFGTEWPPEIFWTRKLHSVIHTPFGYIRKSKKPLPEIWRNTECPFKERTESRNGFSRDEERTESRNAFLRDSIPAIELK